MDSFIREISKKYTNKLDNSKNYYHADDLQKAGLPAVVCKQVEFVIFQIVRGELTTNLAEWIHLDSTSFQNATHAFLMSVQQDLLLPAERAQEIIEASVDRSLKLVVQPLKTIPAFLFDDQQILSKEEMKHKSELIFAHKHLTFALLRYMEKKNRNEIHREQAESVLRVIDERLVKDYNPLNWVNLLRLLFDIAGPEVHSQLLRRFFEEKQMTKVAAKFDELNNSLSETEFIEVMSSAELLNVDGYTEPQHSLFANPISEEKKDIDWNSSDLESVESDLEPVNPPIEEQKITNTNENKGDDFEVVEQTEKSTLSKPEIEKEEKEDNIFELFFTAADEDSLDVGKLDDDTSINDDQMKPEEEETEPIQVDIDEPEEEETAPWDDTEVSEEKDETGESILSKPEIEKEEKEDNIFELFFTAADEDSLDVGKLDDDTSINDDQMEPEEEETEPIQVDINKSEEEEIAPWDDTEVSEEKDYADDLNSDPFQANDEDDPLNQSVDFFDNDEGDEEPDVESDQQEEIEDSNDNDSLANKFVFDNSENEDEEPLLSRIQKGQATIYDELNLVQQDLKSDDIEEGVDSDDEIIENKDEQDEVGLEENSPEHIPESNIMNSEEEADDVPMWKSFLQRDSSNDEPAFYFDDETDSDSTENNDLFNNRDEGQVLINQEGEENEEKMVDKLSDFLNEGKGRYIYGVFGGSEMAYEQALEDLMIFDTWKNASKYLEKEIFTKNKVDIYDEVAVDFTDKLHTYFMELK